MHMLVGVACAVLRYKLPTWLANWITFFILYNNFIPISLYVTIEMVNYVQAMLVDNDASMYDHETSKALMCLWHCCEP